MISPAPVHYLLVPGMDQILGVPQEMKLEIRLPKDNLPL